MKSKIFVLEDESALRELYEYMFESEFETYCFENSENMYTHMADELPDLIILDLMLPGEDGFTTLANLKSERRTSEIPIIIVSAKGEELSKVKGLNMGADDYVAKPFGVLELIARIKANLRKTKLNNKDILIYKDIEIDNTKHTISIRGNIYQFTLKEYELLSQLVKHAESVRTRNDIFDEVWGVDYVGETRTLDMHIKELRKKLTSSGSEAKIDTLRGIGYILL